MVTTSVRSTTEIAARLRLAIVRTARRMRQEAAGAEGGAELSPTLTAALATIANHGPLTPSELADRERVKRPTATRVVSSLEAAGLVERTADPADGRARLVSTTTEGAKLLRRIRGRKTAYIAQRLDGLPPEDVATLARAAEILERMLEHEERST
jgi:DNA-binding MarR family transcriptional regulator